MGDLADFPALILKLFAELRLEDLFSSGIFSRNIWHSLDVIIIVNLNCACTK